MSVEHVDLMRDELKRIIALMSLDPLDTRDIEVTGICERAIAVTEQVTPVIVQRDNAVREMEACHRCWDDFTAKVATVIPQAKNWPLFSQADAIVKRVEALQRIRDYPVHSEPLGGAMAMQAIADEALNS